MLLAMSASDLLMVIVFVVQACIHLTHRLCGVFQGALFLAVRYLAWRVANFSRGGRAGPFAPIPNHALIR